MTPELYKSLAGNLMGDTVSLRQFHAAARDSGSTWSLEQLHLLLACLDDWSVTNVGGEWIVKRAGRSQEEELEEAIVSAVQSQGGKPLPATVVMSLLPGKFTTSEAQIRKLAKESTKLQIFGPGWIGIKAGSSR